MKRLLKYTAFLPLLCLAGCYEDYVKDYDYSTIYSAFQYDLRTFVVGEGQKFDFTVGLAGVMNNSQDRAVKVSLAPDLVTADLKAALSLDISDGSFTALNGMLGKAPAGALSQAYVTEEVSALKLTALTPLPETHFTVSGLDDMTIKAGKHTATCTIAATDAFLADPKGIAPYYAIAFHIDAADADNLPADKCFEVIAVKYECKFYGNWYYGGKAVVVDNVTGMTVSEDNYPLVIPQEDSKVTTLVTTGPNSVKLDKLGGKPGNLTLTFDGENVTVSSPDANLVLGHCYTNDAKCIQDRKIYLNYSYDNKNGTSTVVSDVLTFRNRIRDGINEWQDENPENYK